MAEEKVSELLAVEIRAETEKRLIRKMAEEGGGIWAAYMWMEIAQFFGRTPTPVTEDVGEAEGRDVLFFASYCGDDNPTCTPARPCDDCIAMGNVYRIPNGTRSLFQREFGASHSPPKADGPGEDGWQPIETAPLDRTPVIIAVPDKDRTGHIVGEAYFDPENYGDGDWWWAGTGYGDYHGGPISEINHHQPTHWRPLPVSPSIKRA